ncbi:MAG: TrmH family RNA methyltransferase [Bacteroidota bacterium]
MPLGLLCPDWKDPLNVGAAFRLADAIGASALVLTGSTPHPPQAKIARTARSTEKSVAWVWVPDTLNFMDAPAGFYDSHFSNIDFRGSVFTQANAGSPVLPPVDRHYFLALELTDQSESLLDYRLPEGVMAGHEMLWLLAGNEAHGLGQDILDRCHASAHLPMYGQNTSMNVGVAMGAAAYLLLEKAKLD